MTDFNSTDLRAAFGSFMTGVTLVTARAADGTPVGFTANSFSSVSLDPPLLLVCPGKFLSSFETFHNATHFAVSVLAEGQEDVSNIFASHKGDRFAKVAHDVDQHGVPLIRGAVARFSCVTHQAIPAGDHIVLMGKVVAFDHRGGAGLGYARGHYFSLGLERSASESISGGAVVGAIIETSAGILLEETENGLRPPQITAQSRTNQLEGLTAGLVARGITAELGQVYSAFEDRKLAAHHTYVLATGTPPRGTGDLRCVLPADLADQTYATPAIATMMARFALETQTRNFTLYLGNEGAGDTHHT